VPRSDHTATSGTLTFPTGSTTGATQSITIPLRADLVAEGDETLTVTLANPIGASLTAPSATTVIRPAGDWRLATAGRTRECCGNPTRSHRPRA
jgi:hypothetical protein